jgi:hypothetical protein
MGGKAQSRHVREALGELSPDGSAVLYVLRKKKFVERVENPTGYPFWRVSPGGMKRIGKAKQKALTNQTNECEKEENSVVRP